ncbi:MAG: dTDP-4-dehydrorhamnose 3,5-epimerase [Nitrosomonas sp.]|nr:MAG: dTDP-4-dehydrorhamnose 3,5-epimerase [Nitrosomonas sp.]
MKFTPGSIEGVFLIDLEKRGDDRGFFARFFCQKEFEAHGLPQVFVQANNSLSSEQGTLRGLHYQMPPKQEDKLVRCIKGAIWDVVLDIRPGSKTFGKWFGHTLTAENRTMMFVPKGFAHAFLTLEPDAEVLYLVSEFYAPEQERCIRWNDPAFEILWPAQPVVISDKDANAQDFDPSYHLGMSQ